MDDDKLERYGDGVFDILWKGALQSIIEEFDEVEKGNSKKDSGKHGCESSVTEKCTQAHIEEDFVSQDLLSSSESPLKQPIRKKKKTAIIQSDSETDSSIVNNDDIMENIADVILDSDSDIELVDEQLRPPRSPRFALNTYPQEPRLSTDISEDMDNSSRSENFAYTQCRLTNEPSQSEFKAPPLPLAPPRLRSGLRLRNNNIPPSHSLRSSKRTITKTARTSTMSAGKNSSLAGVTKQSQPLNHSDIFSSDDEDFHFSLAKNPAVLRKGRVRRILSDSDQSNSDEEQVVTGSVRNKRRRVPISLEEELVGEADVSSSEDEEYKQDHNSALIETEAQCASIDSEEFDSDGELEESFINDQTMLSQQFSQDTMHGLYLNSLVSGGWRR